MLKKRKKEEVKRIERDTFDDDDEEEYEEVEVEEEDLKSLPSPKESTKQNSPDKVSIQEFLDGVEGNALRLVQQIRYIRGLM